ncbi:MAG TPA: LLM class flavin-dependent oxidoreductase [Solirubrobacterales bacterium]|nr:LLM class flavin-dependent oxidoreductase [Solirubrobacterales bacterium]
MMMAGSNQADQGLLVGLMTPNVFASEHCDMETLSVAAKIADEGGFDHLWVGDHILWHIPVLDPIVTLGVLAGKTERVTIGTLVLQLPLRAPVLVAQSFATLSHLTGGRVALGVGVGGEWPQEFEAAGVPVEERGARTNEGLRMLRHLWAGEAEQGKFYESPGVAVQPPPVKPIPIYVGGRSDAALRRASREDGFIGYLQTPKKLAEASAKIAELGSPKPGYRLGMQFMTRIEDTKEEAVKLATEALGRTYGAEDVSPFERYVAAGTPEQVAEFVQGYIDGGLNLASFYLHGEGWSEQAERLSKEVLPLLRAG